jgi:hypothetical protein
MKEIQQRWSPAKDADLLKGDEKIKKNYAR